MGTIWFAFLVLQPTQEEDVWKPLKYFVGEWRGQESGSAGVGRGERNYELAIGGQYLVSRNTSVFEPQEKNPSGETHHDWAIFSYDRNRSLFVVRQFHSESFVVQLKQDRAASNPDRFVFVSENVENGPPGLEVRLTLDIKNENQFVETFEVSGGMNVHLTNTWTRAR